MTQQQFGPVIDDGSTLAGGMKTFAVKFVELFVENAQRFSERQASTAEIEKRLAALPKSLPRDKDATKDVGWVPVKELAEGLCLGEKVLIRVPSLLKALGQLTELLAARNRMTPSFNADQAHPRLETLLRLTRNTSASVKVADAKSKAISDPYLGDFVLARFDFGSESSVAAVKLNYYIRLAFFHAPVLAKEDILNLVPACQALVTLLKSPDSSPSVKALRTKDLNENEILAAQETLTLFEDLNYQVMTTLKALVFWMEGSVRRMRDTA
jgi:hypothetical protein